jgi:hypothetical protein
MMTSLAPHQQDGFLREVSPLWWRPDAVEALPGEEMIQSIFLLPAQDGMTATKWDGKKQEGTSGI